MQEHKSVEKRNRQNRKRNIRNTAKRSSMKTAIKRVKTAPDKATAAKELQNVIPILDHLADHKIIHKNKAANVKSKLTRHINTLK